MKHNKKYNIGVIFELLTKQVATGVINEQPAVSKKASTLINKYFSTNALLHEELLLFNILLYNQADSHRVASKLLEGTLVSAQAMEERELIEVKETLIKEISEIFDEQTFFKTKIPNYKVYASIQQLLNLSRKKQNSRKITEKIILEETVIDHLLNNTEVQRAKEQYEKNNKQSVDNFTMKLVLEKFNTKYDSKFNSEQKVLLRDFINNNTQEFEKHAKDEIIKVDSVLEKAINECNDSLLKIKLQDAKKILNEIKTLELSENVLTRLLTYLDLTKDLQAEALNASQI
jgi:uncharacterized protein (DUF1778 family)|tara:strand:- start:625 stop:1488 length:864 start_codon:yes stop_codon:yes gene_type:complete